LRSWRQRRGRGDYGHWGWGNIEVIPGADAQDGSLVGHVDGDRPLVGNGYAEVIGNIHQAWVVGVPVRVVVASLEYVPALVVVIELLILIRNTRNTLVLGNELLILKPQIISPGRGIERVLISIVDVVVRVVVAIVEAVSGTTKALGFGCLQSTRGFASELFHVLLGFVCSTLSSTCCISICRISIWSSSASAISERGFWIVNLVTGVNIGVIGVYRLVRNDIAEHDGWRLGQHQERHQ